MVCPPPRYASGMYVVMLALSFPRRGAPVAGIHAGLWCAGFMLLFITGQTEPFCGVSVHVLVALPLAVLVLLGGGARARACAGA